MSTEEDCRTVGCHAPYPPKNTWRCSWMQGLDGSERRAPSRRRGTCTGRSLRRRPRRKRHSGSTRRNARVRTHWGMCVRCPVGLRKSRCTQRASSSSTRSEGLPRRSSHLFPKSQSTQRKVFSSWVPNTEPWFCQQVGGSRSLDLPPHSDSDLGWGIGRFRLARRAAVLAQGAVQAVPQAGKAAGAAPGGDTVCFMRG